MMYLSTIIPIIVLISINQNIESNCVEKSWVTNSNRGTISKTPVDTTTNFPFESVASRTTTKTSIYVCSNKQSILKPFVHLNSTIMEITNASLILTVSVNNQRESLSCSCGSICFNSNNCSYFTTFTNVQDPEKNCYLYRFLNYNSRIRTLIQRNSYLVQNYTVSSGFNNKTTGLGIFPHKSLLDLQ